MKATATHNSWSAMLQRCRGTLRKSAADYVDRGITVCERWLSFENFLADMGARPSRAHSIDRKNNGGNYEPSNCVWATRSEQGHNKRNNVWLTHNGETLIVADWARRTGMTKETIRRRLLRGWSPSRAVTP